MKRISSVAFAGVLVVLFSAAAQANTITPNPILFTAGVSITYEADLTSGEIHEGDGFTIFDIGGFLGFGALPTDWVATNTLSGSPWSPPTSLGTDDLTLMNVHFEYTGDPFEVAMGSFTYVPFVVLTYSTTLVTDDWLSRDHLLATAGVIDGGVATAHRDNILVPAPVPEAGSSVAFLGLGVMAVALLTRKLTA